MHHIDFNISIFSEYKDLKIQNTLHLGWKLGVFTLLIFLIDKYSIRQIYYSVLRQTSETI